ncbi:twin-arginine translocation signal domain-containing protein, partial [Enterobacter hormaechei]
MNDQQSYSCLCCSDSPGAVLSRRRFLALAAESAAALALFPSLAYAESVPGIAYESVPNLLRLPDDVYF